MAGGYTVYDPQEATKRMNKIQLIYDGMMNKISSTYQSKLIDEMANDWISPNGSKTVKNAVENLNDFLEDMTKNISILFKALDNANLTTQSAFLKGAEEYDGYRYSSIEFTKSTKKFDSKEAKTSKNGKLYIYEAKLINLCGEFDKYESFIKSEMKDLTTQAMGMPIEDESDSIAKQINSASNTIIQKVESNVANVKNTITKKLSETDSDVIQAKNNALAALKNVG